MLVRAKREMLLQRPKGLGRLGSRSFIQGPRKLLGRSSIYIGDDTHIAAGGLISAICSYANQTYSPEVRIGSRVYIGRHVYITAANQVNIADDCVLSEH